MAAITIAKYNSAAEQWELAKAADDLTLNSFSGDGSGLTGLDAGNLSSGSIPDARVPASAVTQHAASLTHANIGGVGGAEDDHTEYVLAAGTRAFSGTVSGITPTVDAHLATKGYVDATASGADPKESSRVATTAELTATYNNGASGVGATLTNNGTQVAYVEDGVTMAVGQRVVVKDQDSNTFENGIYDVTDIGSGSTNWVLTRSEDFDGSPANEVDGGERTLVTEGTVNANDAYVVYNLTAAATIGTSAILWTKFNGLATVEAGAAMTKSGDTINVVAADSTLTINANDMAVNEGGLSLANMGTRLIDNLSDVDTTTAAPSNGQHLEWDGSNWVPATVAAGVTALDDLSDVSTSPKPVLTQDPKHQWLMGSSSTADDTPNGVAAIDLSTEVGAVDAGTNAQFANSNQFDVGDAFKTPANETTLVGDFAWTFTAFVFPKEEITGVGAFATQWNNGVNQTFDMHTVAQGLGLGVKYQYRTAAASTSGTVAITSANAYPVNTMHMVQWGYDPTAGASGEMFLRVNGVAEGTAAQPTINAGSQPLVFGNNFPNADGLEGELDAIYWNDSALTIGDAVNWYAGGAQTFEDFTQAGAPATGNFLRYGGAEWLASDIQDSDITSTMITQHESALTLANMGTKNLTDLDDVTITAGATGEFLRHNGTAWVDATIQTADISSAMVTQHAADIDLADLGTKLIENLSNVDITGLSTNDLLQYNGTNWVPLTADGLGVSELDELTDVTITAAATGEFLRYNGSAWVDSTIQNSDIAEAMVTQHEAALTVTKSQMSDYGEVTLTLGEAVAIGDWVYIDTTAGKAFKAQADSGSSANFPYYRHLFKMKEAGVLDDTKQAFSVEGMQLAGTYTAGNRIYLSSTVAGAEQTVQPTGSGEAKVVLGYAFETNKIAKNVEYFGIA